MFNTSLITELHMETITGIAHKHSARILNFTPHRYGALTLMFECENQHTCTICRNEFNKRDVNGFICYECEIKCRSCKEIIPRYKFNKNRKQCSLYKTCGDCRHNMSINRETNRVAKLNTTADSPFPCMDTDVILHILNLVKNKKGLRFNPLMNYRQVCTRFNECICGYASHELNNADATHKETLLYLSKIGSKITTLSHWDTRYKIPECYRPADNVGDHSDAIKLALRLYGSYENISTHSSMELTKRIMNHYILNNTPCMFDR
jgi:hypothetical protein